MRTLWAEIRSRGRRDCARPIAKLRRAIPAVLGAWIALVAWAAGALAESTVYRVRLDDAIGPASIDFAVRAIARAERDRAEAVVLELDTPGGLDASMRVLVKAILAADVPVVVYVAPSGARAASAGVFIALAAPVSAMAPGTNIGAAHPVGLGGGAPDSVMSRKVVNDAAAYARSLAERHGRNASWAESAVRSSVSLAASEAVRDSVVDLEAESLPELLRRIDGREVRLASGSRILRTEGAVVRDLTMGFRDRALSHLSSPTLAYLLFIGGLLGIAMELYHPGAILPGVVGGISFILALYALQSLPVQWAGVLLILLALVLFALEVKVTSYGILSLGGAASLFAGSLLFFDRESPYRLSLSVILPAVLGLTAFFLFAVTMAARAQRRPAITGREGMIGAVGTALSDLDPEGRVDVHGEYWRARASRPIRAGARVRVIETDGLTAIVESAEETVPGRS